MGKTTLQVSRNTLERLKYFKEFSKESYDEIISKLLNVVEEGELTETAVEKIRQGLKDFEYGRVISIEDYAKKRRLIVK